MQGNGLVGRSRLISLALKNAGSELTEASLVDVVTFDFNTSVSGMH